MRYREIFVEIASQVVGAISERTVCVLNTTFLVIFGVAFAGVVIFIVGFRLGLRIFFVMRSLVVMVIVLRNGSDLSLDYFGGYLRVLLAIEEKHDVLVYGVGEVAEQGHEENDDRDPADHVALE